MDDQPFLPGLEPEESPAAPEPAKKKRVQQHKMPEDALAIKVAKKKKPKRDRSLSTLFQEKLADINLDSLRRPWMATHGFRLIDSDEELSQWVDQVLADTSHYESPGIGRDPCLVVAVDTETTGLDTRILIDLKQETGPDGEELWIPVFEVMVELAGVSLSVDGINGVYVPLCHEKAQNCTREGIHRHLQRLFDQAHLVFYNAKYDREVLRLTAAIEFRDHHHYEDVQALYFNVDPKAQLKDDTFSAASGGLKGLAKEHCGIDMIPLDSITKVSAEWCPLTQSPVCHCDEEQRKQYKHTLKMQYAPFTWVPPSIAVLYAGSDAIATWLLWSKFRDEARSRALVHRIDGELTDSLAWIERQRFHIVTDALRRATQWHAREIETRRERLRSLANKHGWREQTDETTGQVLPETIFDVDKKHLGRFLYNTRNFKVVKQTDKGEPSCDKEAMRALLKQYPGDEFLLALKHYKKIVSLHPNHLRYDPRDNSARIYLKQSVVAGGRLAASGGKFERDGGFGLNIQAIKKIEDRWLVEGRVLVPDYILPDDVEPHEEHELHPSCFRDGKCAPNIIKNHIANYLGYAICLVPSCNTCRARHGVLIEHGKLDAREMLNLRALFGAPEGWTFLSSDWSNIEMRVAANQSLEPKFIKEFLEGSGDFHTLTATNVFPEFSDPATSKDIRKFLRGLAKIMNFALLYGGTYITIFKNLSEQKPGLTQEEARKLVERYWEGVPVYKAFCDKLQKRARRFLDCETGTGRVIKFASAFKREGIHKPTKQETDQVIQWYRIRKEMYRLKELAALETDAGGRETLEAKIAELADILDQMYRDETTGVRNAIAYRKFMSKIERVAVNAPLQGLAGDLMRMAINNIREWATVTDPLVQSILRLHGSVHDELDYAVKNPYAPFAIPRITRKMKLRRLHQAKQWPVPIECDTEYGASWDVVFHLTGDSDHPASGYTDIPGLERYLPPDFSEELVAKLADAMLSGREALRTQAWDTLAEWLHPRAHDALKNAFVRKDKKTGIESPVTDRALVERGLIIAMQLDEYWRIDETPDDAPYGTLETLVQYEQRRGLTIKDRGFMPPGGFLSTLPLEGVKRPALLKLVERPAPPPPSPDDSGSPIPPAPEPTAAPVAPVSEAAASVPAAISRPKDPPRTLVLIKPAPKPEEPEPRKEDPLPRMRLVNSVALPPPDRIPTYRIRPLTSEETLELKVHLLPNHGDLSIRLLLRDQTIVLNNVKRNTVPSSMLDTSTGERVG